MSQAEMDAVIGSISILSLAFSFVGFGIAILSGLIVRLKESRFSHEEIGTWTPGLNILSALGLLFAGSISNRIGRRHSIMSAMAVVFIGCLLIGSFVINYDVFFLGHLLANMGIGHVLVTTQIYVAEVSPVRSRGRLIILSVLFYHAGTVIGYIFAFFFPPESILDLDWRILFAVGVIFLSLLAVLVYAMPESPHWLVMKGRLDDAERVLHKISNSNAEVTRRLDDIKKAAGVRRRRNVVHVTQQGVWQDIFLRPSHPVCHMLLCVVSMQLLRQVSSVDAIVNNTLILSKTSLNLNEADKKLITTMIMGKIKFFSMVFSAFLVDHIGRRPLVLISVAGMVFSLMAFGFSLDNIKNDDTSISDTVHAMSTLSTISYVGFLSIGLGSVTSVFSSEVFPVKLRAMGSAVGVATNQALNGISSTFFLWLCDMVGFKWSVSLMTTFVGFMWVLFFAIMPETKAKTLEQLMKLFGTYSTLNAVAIQSDLGPAPAPINNDDDDDDDDISPPSRTAAAHQRSSHRHE